MTAPVDPEEFKFCCALMNAGYSCRMPSAKPTGTVLIADENSEVTQAISFTDTPYNRAMHAVRAHYWDTRPEERQDEFMPMAWRLMSFGEFVRRCLEKKAPKIAPFVEMKDGELSGIADALLEAAAVVTVRARGFSQREMFAEAKRRAEAAESEEERAKRATAIQS